MQTAALFIEFIASVALALRVLSPARAAQAALAALLRLRRGLRGTAVELLLERTETRHDAVYGAALAGIADSEEPSVVAAYVEGMFDV